MQDKHFMSLALEEARKGLWSASPNPRVGCVMVKNGHILSTGFHEYAGGPHAEVVAIKANRENLEGATAYVTLEPCSHYGRTSPCCLELIKLNLARVVIGMLDPNPLVAGRGARALEEAGVAVDVGIRESEARELNRGYIKQMAGKGPWLSGKVAVSADGKMALENGESKWITGETARRDVMNLRAQSCAMLTGIKTIIEDDPQLNVRINQLGRKLKQPDLIILDTTLRMKTSFSVLETLKNRNVILVTSQEIDNKIKEYDLITAGFNIVRLPEDNGKICLKALCYWLSETEYNEVMVESGPTLMNELIRHRLLDELVVYQAPIFLGPAAIPMFQGKVDKLSEAIRFDTQYCEQIGTDIKINYRLTVDMY